ncbi:hypothetical protein ABTD78_25835, partial [Acinetobacter baumannii]
MSTANGQTTTLNAAVSGSAGNTLTVIGGGTLRPTVAGTYAGDTIVNGGSMLSISAANQLGNSANLQLSSGT